MIVTLEVLTRLFTAPGSPILTTTLEAEFPDDVTTLDAERVGYQWFKKNRNPNYATCLGVNVITPLAI